MTCVLQNVSLHKRSWTALPRRLASKMRAVISETIDHNRTKATLSNLSAKNLRDIGLIVNDVTTIECLSLLSTAAHKISEIRRKRSANW